jgi:hypothetical protein
MGTALFVGLATVVGGGASALAWIQARRTASPDLEAVPALARALKLVPPHDRLLELRRRADPGSWEHELAGEALTVADGALIPTVNLALADLEHHLTARTSWPRAALRIALLGAALVACFAYLDAGSVERSLGIVGVGAVAAILCHEAERTARRNAARQREAADALVATVFSHLDPLDREGEAPRRARSGGTARATGRSRRQGVT